MHCAKIVKVKCGDALNPSRFKSRASVLLLLALLLLVCWQSSEGGR